MFWMFCAIAILAIALFYKDKINGKFNNPSMEELENYQASVFLHIDDEIIKYKKDIKSSYDEIGYPLIKKMESLNNELDKKLAQYEAIEKRIDEKIIKLKDFKDLIS